MIGLFMMGLCVFLRFEVEADIGVTFEDVDIKYLDPKYFDADATDIYIQENDEGEVVLVSTITMRDPIPADTSAHLSILGLSMGAFKIPMGMDLEMSVCDMPDEPVIVGPLIKAFGFTKENCPPVAGTYAQDGYKPPLDLMPDSFPENKYQGRLQMLDGSTEIFDCTVEIDIKMS